MNVFLILEYVDLYEGVDSTKANTNYFFKCKPINYVLDFILQPIAQEMGLVMWDFPTTPSTDVYQNK